MNKRLLFISLFFFSFLTQARTLTWKEAIELTQKNSSELNAAVFNYNAALETEKAIYAAFLPKISASLSGSESGAPSTASQFSYSAGLSYSQSLFSGFSDVNNYKIKKINTQQSLLELNNIKARMSQELKVVFSSAYYSQLNKKLTENILKRREENLRSVQLQYEVGRENKGSYLLSLANVESAKLDVIRAENEQNINMENLKRYIGLSEEEITIEQNIAKETDVQKPDFQKLAENNYLVLKAKNDELISQYNLNISKAQFSPNLSFNASYGYSDSQFFPKNDSWSMGLTLSMSLFDGMSDIAAYSANQYKLKSSSSSLQNTMLEVTKNLKNAYLDYLESLQQEKVDTAFNQATLLRSDIARSKYKTGLLSFEDWDLIESDLIQKQKQFLLTEKNRILKQSLWEQAQGVGVFQ